MAFTNVQVTLSELPTFEDIDYLDLERSYAWLVCLVALTVEVVIVAIAIVLSMVIPPPPPMQGLGTSIGLAVLIVMAWIPIYRFKAARVTRYAIRDHDLLLRSGLFWQSEVIQPIKRIQHVELLRGPLERRLGLANVRLYSAGSGKATFTIPGLRLLTAARMRRYILQTDRRR